MDVVSSEEIGEYWAVDIERIKADGLKLKAIFSALCVILPLIAFGFLTDEKVKELQFQRDTYKQDAAEAQYYLTNCQ